MLHHGKLLNQVIVAKLCTFSEAPPHGLMGRVSIISQAGCFLTTVTEDSDSALHWLSLEKGLGLKGDTSVLQIAREISW